MPFIRRFKPTTCLALVLVCCLGFAFCANAQTPTGNIEGTVVDRTGLIITNAKAFVVDSATNARRESEVEANGQFRFTALPIGDYSLHIESPSFANLIENAIHMVFCSDLSSHIVGPRASAHRPEVEAVRGFLDFEQFYTVGFPMGTQGC